MIEIFKKEKEGINKQRIILLDCFIKWMIDCNNCFWWIEKNLRLGDFICLDCLIDIVVVDIFDGLFICNLFPIEYG